MYAIIESGGKQYRVEEGDEIDVELLHIGGAVEFHEVLLLNDGQSIVIGAPYIEQCKVRGELLEGVIKGPKVTSYKYKKRHNYSRKVGHRQKYSRVKITKIETKGE